MTKVGKQLLMMLDRITVLEASRAQARKTLTKVEKKLADAQAELKTLPGTKVGVPVIIGDKMVTRYADWVKVQKAPKAI